MKGASQSSGLWNKLGFDLQESYRCGKKQLCELGKFHAHRHIGRSLNFQIQTQRFQNDLSQKHDQGLLRSQNGHSGVAHVSLLPHWILLALGYSWSSDRCQHLLCPPNLLYRALNAIYELYWDELDCQIHQRRDIQIKRPGHLWSNHHQDWWV